MKRTEGAKRIVCVASVWYVMTWDTTAQEWRRSPPFKSRREAAEHARQGTR